MLKRLFIIGILTGFGHLVTLLALKYITKNVESATIAYIGEVDSLSLLIVSIIAFGLQLSATRELAILDNWKEEYYKTQSARFTLSIFLFFLGFLGYFYTKNYLFFIAPIIALNADYALYGRGKPIIGAIVALMRVLIPSLTLVLCSIYYLDNLVFYYSISIIVAYFLTGLAVSRTLKVSYFVKPKFNSLLKYFYNIRIGIANFSLFFVGIGIINVMAYFYNETSIAAIYVALKLYMIFKGVRRIIVQSFFKELKDISVALKIDYFAVVAGVVFLSSLLFFPKAVITLLFDEKYYRYSTTFLILGIAGFLSSFTTSSGTRLLLKKKDKAYSRNLVLAAVVAISSGLGLWLLFGEKPYLIAISILLGEITISVLNVISLAERQFLIKRIKISLPIFLAALIFSGFNFFLGENIIILLTSLLFHAIFVIIYTKKRLNFL